MLIERQNTILEMARQSGRVMVDELAQRFEVTPQTIRKDLNELCDQRMLARIHGGAILSSGVENVGYDARRTIASEEKEAIGAAPRRASPTRHRCSSISARRRRRWRAPCCSTTG